MKQQVRMPDDRTLLLPERRGNKPVNGRARINVYPAVLASFTLQGQAPQRPPVPTAGQVVGTLTQRGIDGAADDRELPARQSGTLY